MVAVSSNIDSLHRMTREEREPHGVLVNSSDHLTAYNLYAEAVNQHGYLGEVYGLPRHLFEEGLEEWAERRGVLVKSIEDTALGLASVYRSLELPLPKQLPYASKEIRKAWTELLARIMPFDLVIDEHTADGQEAPNLEELRRGELGRGRGQPAILRRSLRRAAGRHRRNDAVVRCRSGACGARARRGRARRESQAPGTRRERRLTYFGFELETEIEPLEGQFPSRCVRRRAMFWRRRSSQETPCIRISPRSGAR